MAKVPAGSIHVAAADVAGYFKLAFATQFDNFLPNWPSFQQL
jgi:hypothetical protein